MQRDGGVQVVVCGAYHGFPAAPHRGIPFYGLADRADFRLDLDTALAAALTAHIAAQQVHIVVDHGEVVARGETVRNAVTRLFMRTELADRAEVGADVVLEPVEGELRRLDPVTAVGAMPRRAGREDDLGPALGGQPRVAAGGALRPEH